jgi:subtilisin family serine protease
VLALLTLDASLSAPACFYLLKKEIVSEISRSVYVYGKKGMLLRFTAAGMMLNYMVAGSAAAGEEDLIKGQYIVVLKGETFVQGVNVTSSGESVSEMAERLMSDAREHQVLIDAKKGVYRSQAQAEAANKQDLIYEYALKGFSASLTEEAVKFLQKRPEIKYIEQEKKIYPQAVQANPPSWGLDRIDQRDLPLNDRYVYSSSGRNVHMYIVDSGLDMSHPEFTGRVATDGYDFYDRDSDPSDTCNGHGTHVAGIAGGRTVGVAKNVTIHPYKVFGCDEFTTPSSVVIAALDGIVRDPRLPGVVNMSLGGDVDGAVDDAVEQVLATGLTVVVAAGNDGKNACDVSPARVSDAITVAASDAADERSVYNTTYSSNMGPCIDIVAPGSDIYSSFVRGLDREVGCDDPDGDGYASCPGTSMASPHVAGLAVQYLQRYPTASPTEVASAIISASSKNRLSNFEADTPNRMAFTEFGGSIAQPNIVAIAYVDSSKMACAWYENSYVSCGSTSDLNSIRSAYRYTLPSGYTPNDIVGIAWVDTHHMACAFYRDGRVSCGTTRDLDSVRSLYNYTLPAGYSPEDVKGVAYTVRYKRACAWYDDGNMSCGTTRDLDSLSAAAIYHMPAEYYPQAIKGVAWVEHHNMPCAWYSNGFVSCGTGGSLTGVRAPYPYKTLE